MAKDLKRKPLVEAILEIRWHLPEQPGGDPNYRLLLGRMFDRLLKEYPAHEPLPPSTIPDELAAYTAQHRFRIASDKWPLIQLRPGLFSVNSTDDYKWSDFKPRALSAVKKLFEAHPKPEEFNVTNLVLRYIDAIAFDYLNDNAFKFLNDMMKLNIGIPGNLFDKTGVAQNPEGLLFQSSFVCQKPKGRIQTRFSTGNWTGKPAIIWETVVTSAGKDIIAMPEGFETWLDAAHTLTDDWFFKMIEGELEKRFSGG